MVPEHAVGVVEHARLLQGAHIAAVALHALRVVGLEDAGDAAMAEREQMLCDEIAAAGVVQQHVGPVAHALKAALNKYIGDAARVKALVQGGVAAEDLAFARLDDEAVDGLVRKLFQIARLQMAGVVRAL